MRKRKNYCVAENHCCTLQICCCTDIPVAALNQLLLYWPSMVKDGNICGLQGWHSKTAVPAHKTLLPHWLSLLPHTQFCHCIRCLFTHQDPPQGGQSWSASTYFFSQWTPLHTICTWCYPSCLGLFTSLLLIFHPSHPLVRLHFAELTQVHLSTLMRDNMVIQPDLWSENLGTGASGEFGCSFIMFGHVSPQGGCFREVSLAQCTEVCSLVQMFSSDVGLEMGDRATLLWAEFAGQIHSGDTLESIFYFVLLVSWAQILNSCLSCHLHQLSVHFEDHRLWLLPHLFDLNSCHRICGKDWWKDLVGTLDGSLHQPLQGSPHWGMPSAWPRTHSCQWTYLGHSLITCSPQVSGLLCSLSPGTSPFQILPSFLVDTPPFCLKTHKRLFSTLHNEQLLLHCNWWTLYRFNCCHTKWAAAAHQENRPLWTPAPRYMYSKPQLPHTSSCYHTAITSCHTDNTVATPYVQSNIEKVAYLQAAR